MTSHVIANRYEVVRELARSGPRSTYLARDRTTSADVVVSQVALGDDPDADTAIAAVDALSREADSLRAIDHPGVPAFVEYQPVELSREALLVRAFAPGQPLAARRRTDVELLAVIEAVVAILADIAPKTHGALSPHRIIVDGDEVALVGLGSAEPVPDLVALASLLADRPALRSLADALRAPSASFRGASIAIAASRNAVAKTPSADDVAAMRARAEADAKRVEERERAEQARIAEKQRARDRSRRGRVQVDTVADGSTITIGRGSSSWILFSIVPSMLFALIGTPLLVSHGLVTLAITLPVVGLLLLGLRYITRPHRLLLTSRGDFVVHRGDPRKPVCIGRIDELRVQITTFTNRRGAVLGLLFPSYSHGWHPLSTADVDAFTNAARPHDLEVQKVHA